MYLPGKLNCCLWLACGVGILWTAGLEGVELLQLDVFELESGG